MKAQLRVTVMLQIALIVISASLLSACTSAPQVEDRFVQNTGATWRVAGQPMVFERTEARFSRSARDYTYVGPVAVNRRGTYDYFLWIGIGSTLDRGFLAPEATAPESLLVFVGEEPFELPLADWDARIPGLTGQIPYDPPVTVQWHMAARVTLDQIALISERGIDHLLLHTPDGSSRDFFEWGEQPDWATFVADSR